MSYIYSLEKSSFAKEYIIKEFFEMKLEAWFFVQEIIYKKTGKQSYNRIKNWLLENHPELLL